MKYNPIKKFGSKLMVSSKSINRIPQEFLRYAENARIYDGGIGPRRGKQLFTDSIVGTNNKGGFIMGGVLYQVTNSRIYSIDSLGEQTEIVELGYDARIDNLVYNDFTIIVSDGEDGVVFDGTTITTPTTIPDNNGIIEYCRGFSFLVDGNVLYISRPITPDNPERAYDFTGSGAQSITYESEIKGLKGTMNGLYVFTQDRVEFLGANSLQNIAGAAAFISTPLGDGGELIENELVATSGDKIFYITKNLNINTINYVQGTAEPGLGELSNQPVIGIKELLRNINIDQESGFAFNNDNDNTIQFHLRTVGSPFNDICIIYDMINETWSIDTGKNYNYVLRLGSEYYGFSDINSSIYKDDVGNSDGGIPIRFLIRTQELNLGTMIQKIFGGFFTSGGISGLTDLDYRVYVDGEEVFDDQVIGQDLNLVGIGEIAGNPIGTEGIGGNMGYQATLNPFDFEADVGRIYQGGIRIAIEIESQSQIQDFIIDGLGVISEQTPNIDIRNKF